MQIFGPDEGASKRRSCVKMPQQWPERQDAMSQNQVGWFKVGKKVV